MAQEPQIWSCSANGNVYYSSKNNSDWQIICAGMSSISAGHSGVVCAIDNEGVVNIRTGISDSKPYGLGWTSLLCEGKYIFVGSRKIVRITQENKIFAAILPNIVDKSVYVSWYVVNIKDSISESDLLSLDVSDNLYIACKSGDIFVYVENQSAMEQSFWKLIITGPKVPQGLLSRLKSFASLGLLSDENNNSVDVCSFLVGEKFMWLIRKNSKEIYQLEFDYTTEEPVNSWNRFRLDSKWTINNICGCKDTMIWAITNDNKLVTITCTPKSVSVKECPVPSLTGEDYSKFYWASVSIGYTRRLSSQMLQENEALPIKNIRVPPSTLSIYPSLSGHESELTSNGSMQHSGECCDDGSCSFCMGQKEKTLNDSLSPVLMTLQKRGQLSSSPYSPELKVGAKRKADLSSNHNPICNERVILKAKRRKIKSQLPKLKILEGIKMSLSKKLKKSNQYLMMYNPKTLQATNSTFEVNTDEKLFDFNLEEECLSSEEPMPTSIPCSEEVMMLSSSSSVNNNTESFELACPVAMCTSITPITTNTTTAVLSSPVQETCSDENFLQPTENSIQPSENPTQPLSFSTILNPYVPSIELASGAVSSSTPASPPPAPPLPPLPWSMPPTMLHTPEQNMISVESHDDIYEGEEVEFKADSSSDEQTEREEQITFWN